MAIKISKSELPAEGSFKYYDFPEVKNEYLVYKEVGKPYAVFSSFCPHFGGPLAVKDGRLHCHFHDYWFSLSDGKCLNKEFGGKCQIINYFMDADAMIIEEEE